MDVERAWRRERRRRISIAVMYNARVERGEIMSKWSVIMCLIENEDESRPI